MVTPIAVVTEQQLVLGGETRPAGTLGARAPETGVGGWGRGWIPGALMRKLALQSLLWSPLALSGLTQCGLDYVATER